MALTNLVCDKNILIIDELISHFNGDRIVSELEKKTGNVLLPKRQVKVETTSISVGITTPIY